MQFKKLVEKQRMDGLDFNYDNEIGTEEDSEPSTAIDGGYIIIHQEK